MKLKLVSVPAEVLELHRSLQITGGRHGGSKGKKSSVYMRTTVLDLLDQATVEWDLPMSAIVNIAVRLYLERAGFKQRGKRS